jgi:hypothetical protein
MRRKLPVCDPIPKSELDSSDPRSVQKTDLSALVEQVVSLSEVQRRRRLYEVLLKYLSHMTTKPGRCNLFSYKFQVNTDTPIVGYSRPIPFTTRPAVREQINQMLKDGILEISTSPILNPLTVVNRERKKIRICVNARNVNRCTAPDRERSPPIHELLQRFNGARYLTSLDLNSAYLQIELHAESRKYKAFFFDSTVDQFTRVPYGFKNSLPVFVRAFKLALGESTIENVVFYIGDILVHLKTFGK